jgi:hypothetical protein
MKRGIAHDNAPFLKKTNLSRRNAQTPAILALVNKTRIGNLPVAIDCYDWRAKVTNIIIGELAFEIINRPTPISADGILENITVRR